jgi:two-component system sensor histidine kinase QseC
MIDDVRLPDGRRARRVLLSFVPRREPATGGEEGMAPTAHLAYARSTDELDATLAALDRVLASVALAATLLALAVIVLVTRFALRPVHALAESIASLDAERLDTRIDSDDRPAELRVVTRRLDELLRRLADAFERERRLTAEVAHELRTPLAGLRATTELALARDRTPERYRSALSECLAICVATERVVETLLSLARLDAGQIDARLHPVPLDELVREQLAAVADRASSRGLTVESELAAAVITSDPDLLRIVIANLLDNAVTYVDPGGNVRVTVTPEASLRIANTGCKLAPGQVAHAFRRFWRGDEARGGGGAHAGLGLALARELVQLLGGTLEARVDDGWFVATASLAAGRARSTRAG